MKRDFLKGLGIEDEVIDKILDENSRDIGREKQKADTAKQDLADVQGKLTAAQGELETLKASNGDAAKLQQQLSDLQAKYDADTNDLRGQLADREYSDAISRAISGKALKFSSKSAERAFTAALREKKLELKDGELTGLDDFIKEQKESDPDAFAPDNPPPRFATGAGNGGGHGNPNQTKSTAELLAQTIGKAKAESGKAANSIINSYTGGNANGT